MEYLWVGIGGFFGANARYAMTRLAVDRFGPNYPWGTFLINLAGAFLIGVVLTIITDRAIADPFWRQVIVVGFLGGFTTFSAYTFEAIALAQRGDWGAAGFYVLGSNVLGLVACLAGIGLARSLGL
ncbi:MAG TPA: fluoride efflux transporter CrcB [Thermomicrobiales bacterium]|nr:fluoride efflux transporter CrcB [Thermomicrobiales bacterium]